MRRRPCRAVAPQACHFLEDGGAEIGVWVAAEKAAQVNSRRQVIVGPPDLLLVFKVGDIAQAADDDVYFLVVCNTPLLTQYR